MSDSTARASFEAQYDGQPWAHWLQDKSSCGTYLVKPIEEAWQLWLRAWDASRTSTIKELSGEGAREDTLREALERIENWSNAYPLEAFPEPDLAKSAEVLKAAGLSLDQISAHNMRHVVERVGEIARAALKDSPPLTVEEK